MRTIYPTTRAAWYDTKAIAKQKLLQQLQSPTAAYAGLIAEPDNTENNYQDTELKSLQKILTALQ